MFSKLVVLSALGLARALDDGSALLQGSSFVHEPEGTPGDMLIFQVSRDPKYKMKIYDLCEAAGSPSKGRDKGNYLPFIPRTPCEHRLAGSLMCDLFERVDPAIAKSALCSSGEGRHAPVLDATADVKALQAAMLAKLTDNNFQLLIGTKAGEGGAATGGSETNGGTLMATQLFSTPSFKHTIKRVCADPWAPAVAEKEKVESLMLANSEASMPFHPTTACETAAASDLLCELLKRSDRKVADAAMCSKQIKERKPPTLELGAKWFQMSQTIEQDLVTNMDVVTTKLVSLQPKTITELEEAGYGVDKVVRAKVASSRKFKSLVAQACGKAGSTIHASSTITNDDTTLFVPESPCEKTASASLYCSALRLYNSSVAECVGTLPQAALPQLQEPVDTAVGNILEKVDKIRDSMVL